MCLQEFGNPYNSFKKNEMRPYVVHGCVVIATICSYIDAASCRKNQIHV